MQCTQPKLYSQAKCKSTSTRIQRACRVSKARQMDTEIRDQRYARGAIARRPRQRGRPSGRASAAVFALAASPQVATSRRGGICNAMDVHAAMRALTMERSTGALVAESEDLHAILRAAGERAERGCGLARDLAGRVCRDGASAVALCEQVGRDVAVAEQVVAERVSAGERASTDRADRLAVVVAECRAIVDSSVSLDPSAKEACLRVMKSLAAEELPDTSRSETSDAVQRIQECDATQCARSRLAISAHALASGRALLAASTADLCSSSAAVDAIRMHLSALKDRSQHSASLRMDAETVEQSLAGHREREAQVQSDVAAIEEHSRQLEGALTAQNSDNQALEQAASALMERFARLEGRELVSSIIMPCKQLLMATQLQRDQVLQQVVHARSASQEERGQGLRLAQDLLITRDGLRHLRSELHLETMAIAELEALQAATQRRLQHVSERIGQARGELETASHEASTHRGVVADLRGRYSMPLTSSARLAAGTARLAQDISTTCAALDGPSWVSQVQELGVLLGRAAGLAPADLWADAGDSPSLESALATIRAERARAGMHRDRLAELAVHMDRTDKALAQREASAAAIRARVAAQFARSTGTC